MKQGRHQLRWQFNCLTHNPSTPIRFQLDNGDYDRNFRIDSFEVIFSCMDRTTNAQNISGQTHQVVLATSEQGATPISTESVNNRAYSMRVADRRQLAWAQMDDQMNNTILDPHNIVASDLWLNAWCFSPAHGLDDLQQDIGVLITLTEVKQSGAEGLLSTIRDSNIE